MRITLSLCVLLMVTFVEAQCKYKGLDYSIGSIECHNSGYRITNISGKEYQLIKSVEAPCSGPECNQFRIVISSTQPMSVNSDGDRIYGSQWTEFFNMLSVPSYVGRGMRCELINNNYQWTPTLDICNIT